MNSSVEHHYEDVLAKIFEYLEEHLTQRPSQPITAQSHLIRDIGLDSLQSFEMISDLEDHFKVVIPMDLFQNVETLEDVAHAVLKAIQSEAA
jgi:acyl carrier protein